MEKEDYLKLSKKEQLEYLEKEVKKLPLMQQAIPLGQIEAIKELRKNMGDE